MVEILVATITGLFAVIGILVRNRLKTLEVLSQQQGEEISFRSDALALKIDLSKWSSINQEIRKLMNETCIDRFFILNAFNGYHDPRWTTAVYQVQKEDANIVGYTHFGIDDHYVSLLKLVRSQKHIEIPVSELPESIIRSVYHTEGVLSSQWYYLKDKELPSGAVGMTYASFSSRTCDALSDAELERCQIIIQKILGAIDNVK